MRASCNNDLSASGGELQQKNKSLLLLLVIAVSITCGADMCATQHRSSSMASKPWQMGGDLPHLMSFTKPAIGKRLRTLFAMFSNISCHTSSWRVSDITCILQLMIECLDVTVIRICVCVHDLTRHARPQCKHMYSKAYEHRR